MLLYLNETLSIDLTLLKVDTEITSLSLINPVNINNATARVPLPAALGGGLMLPIASSGGVLSVGATDAGLVYKFAGFMCLAPFNPFDTTGTLSCKGDDLGVPVDVPEWGGDLNLAMSALPTGIWWTALFPGLAIFFLVLGLSLIGEGLEDNV